MATAPRIPENQRYSALRQPGRMKTGSPASPHASTPAERKPQMRGGEGRRGAKAEGRGAKRRYLDTTSNISQGFGIVGTTENYVDEVLPEKLRESLVLSLQRCGRDKEAKALATCGKYFDVWFKEPDAVLIPCPCNSPFCPECANRRSLPMRKKLEGMVNRRGRSYWFLTLTVPNQEKITRADMTRISKSFAKLWESDVFQSFADGPRSEPMRIFGGVRSIECTWDGPWDGRRGGWHPHIHVLLECPKKLPLSWLDAVKAKWLEITGVAKFVHLQEAYYVTKEGKKKKKRLNRKALRELCKYVTKSASFAHDHLLVDEFLTAFKGLRRVQFFGDYFGEAAKEFEREPGCDLEQIRTKLTADGYHRVPFKAHLSDTFLTADGTRQLTFEFMERVRCVMTSREESPHDDPWFTSPEACDDSQRELPMNPGVFVEQSAEQIGLF
jgi:hypothetical protein